MVDWIGMGVSRQKSSPPLAIANLVFYDPAVQFLGRYLKELGYDVAEAWLEPYTERWFYYEHADPFRPDADTTFIIAIPHDVIETLNEKLAKSVVKPVMPLPRKGKSYG